MGLTDETRWVDALAIGEEDGEPSESFRIDTDDLCEWALRKIAEKRARIAANAERADRELDRLKAQMQRVEQRLTEINAEDVRGVAFLESHVRAYAESKKTEWLKGKVKSRKFINGTVKWRKSVGGLVISEGETLEAWATEMGLYRIKPNHAAIREHFRKTGEVPPDCELKTEEDVLSIETEES